MKAITNTKLVMEDGIIWDGILTYENGIILEVGHAKDIVIPKDAEIIDAGGLYTAPGLIDIHNHGFGGHLFWEKPLECCKYFLAHGETTVLPTFYSDMTLEQYKESADLIRKQSKFGAGKIMEGIYMEGPYMRPEGGNEKYIKWRGKITQEEFQPLVDSLSDIVRIWAVDPERNVDDFMAYEKKRNPKVIFALGHSHATSEQCRRIRHYGVQVQTHHGDSGQAPGRAQGTPGAGCDEYTLYDPDIYAELVCDYCGIHVVPDLLKLVVRVKGVERVILITDCDAWDEQFTNNEAEGIAYGPDLSYDYRGYLNGSKLTLEDACRNMMQHTGYGLCHCIRMATLNPARLLGLDDQLGSLAPGKRANLILIDDMVHVNAVFLDGKQVAKNGALLI